MFDEINSLKKEMESDKQKLDSLLQTKEKIATLQKAEIKLSELCITLMKVIATPETKYRRRHPIRDNTP